MDLNSKVLWTSAARMGLVAAALSAWAIAPAVWGQSSSSAGSSSSADYNQEMAALMQDSQPYSGNQPYSSNQPYQGNQGNQGNQPYQGNQSNQPYQGNQSNQPYQGNQGNQPYQGNQSNQPYQGNQVYQGNKPYQGNQGNQPYQGNQGNQPYQGNQGNQPYSGSQLYRGNESGYSPQGYSPSRYASSSFSHLAFEAGGGFNRPLNNTRTFETWGGNATVGAGVNFNRRLGLLAEWQFFDDKIPGAYLANVGAPGGYVHTWGATLEPIFYIKNKGTIGAYIIGGGGFYRRVTTFTAPQLVQECYYYYYSCGPGVANVPIAHYSSNQYGANGGLGFTWRAFGSSSAKLYMEARYVWVNTPKKNVFGTPDGKEVFAPVNIGIRW